MISDDILYIIVSCCKEDSRYNVLSKIVDNFNYNFLDEFDIQDSLIVFDNASNEKTVELLKNNFKNIFRCEDNIGYWTALYWCLKNAEDKLNKKFKYVHIMESDHLYHDVYKIEWCKEILDIEPMIGAIKCHEYYPALYYLYNKANCIKKTRKHDWISHQNMFAKTNVELYRIKDYYNHFFISTFITQLHNITRFQTMVDIFDELKTLKSFNEGEFHKKYFNKHKFVGVLDGGIFNMKLGYSEAVAGSAHGSNDQLLKKHGYVSTTLDRILEDDKYIVNRVETCLK